MEILVSNLEFCFSQHNISLHEVKYRKVRNWAQHVPVWTIDLLVAKSFWYAHSYSKPKKHSTAVLELALIYLLASTRGNSFYSNKESTGDGKLILLHSCPSTGAKKDAGVFLGGNRFILCPILIDP